MTLLLHKFKTKTGISITLVNPESSYKEINLWDGHCDEFPNKNLPNEINIGHIIISCSNAYFFSQNNYIQIGDKKYKISHYLKDGMCIIYDFKCGWLSPLNIQLNTNIPIILTVPSSTSVVVSISVI